MLGKVQAEGLRFRNAAGATREIEADAIAFGYGLRSETQLANLAGCRFAFDSIDRQWLPEKDVAGRALGMANIYLAGDGAGITGADAAEAAGERAALALLSDRGKAVSAERCQALERSLARLRRFREGLAEAFPFPAHLARRIGDETILCRCELVSAGSLRAAVSGIDAHDVNRAKAYSRVGMGRCRAGSAGLRPRKYCRQR